MEPIKKEHPKGCSFFIACRDLSRHKSDRKRRRQQEEDAPLFQSPLERQRDIARYAIRCQHRSLFPACRGHRSQYFLL